MRDFGYAIRHIPTGKFLPWMRRGSSHWDPVETDESCFPMLYKTKQAAMYVANTWARGAIYPVYTDSWEGTEYHGLEQKPVEGRNRADLEIVEIKLVIP